MAAAWTIPAMSASRAAGGREGNGHVVRLRRVHIRDAAEHQAQLRTPHSFRIPQAHLGASLQAQLLFDAHWQRDGRGRRLLQAGCLLPGLRTLASAAWAPPAAPRPAAWPDWAWGQLRAQWQGQLRAPPPSPPPAAAVAAKPPAAANVAPAAAAPQQWGPRRWSATATEPRPPAFPPVQRETRSRCGPRWSRHSTPARTPRSTAVEHMQSGGAAAAVAIVASLDAVVEARHHQMATRCWPKKQPAMEAKLNKVKHHVDYSRNPAESYVQ